MYSIPWIWEHKIKNDESGQEWEWASEWTDVQTRDREKGMQTEICRKDDEKEWKWKRIKRGERCKESRDKERGRQTQREKERLLVSSFLLVIGFSDWSKLFFSILLLSLSHRHLFSPLHGVKDKADGPNCVAGPCSQQWPFEANFPAHGAEKDRERRIERDGGTWRRVEGWGVFGEAEGG